MSLMPGTVSSRARPRWVCASLVVLVMSVVAISSASSSSAAPFSIPSPVAGGWQLNGTALLNTTASPPNLQLTAATNWQAGSAFYPIPVPGVGITATFDAFIGSGSGADGLTFTLADASVTQPTALGVNGGGEGFSGVTGIAVSLDTWKNAVNPSNNFVGIANGSVPGAGNELNYVATNTSIPSLENATHHFVVTTTSTGITVTMDGTQVLNYATTSLPPYVLVGFTGGTGGFNDIHQVQNVSITAGPPPPVPTVTGLSPSSGPNGTSVAITGTGFTAASTVKFGTAAANFVVSSSTGITATAPTGTGTVDVTVTTPGGTSTTNPSDRYTYVPVPTVTGVSPTSGPSTGGTAVTITGTNFTGTSAVRFGPTAANFTVNNSTAIKATAPPGVTGPVDVTVTSSFGTSATSAADSYTYTLPPAPTVTGVSPDSGPNGTLVTLSGTGFTGATTVDFGASAATFAVDNSTTITATAPAGTPGQVDVTVTTPGGTSALSAADQYTYVAGSPLGSIPSPVTGGWQLNGTAQLNTAGSPPNLELTAASSYQAGSAFYPTAVPGVGITTAFDAFIGQGSGADGLTLTLADATVTKPSALGSNGGGEGFSGITGFAVSLDTYKNGVNPSNNFVGIANGPVPGAGNELNYLTTNSSIAPLRNTWHHFVVTTSSTGITVTMDGVQVLSYATSLPPSVLVGFTAGTGGLTDVHEVQNVVITTGGSSPAGPSVTSLAPSSGPSTGGTSVTVTGTGFTGASAVKFGTTAATSFTVNSATSITATPRRHGHRRRHRHDAPGTSATSAADQFTYLAGPSVTSLAPSSGPSTGGTSVTVTGTGFTGASAVNFGTTAATSFTVNSATSITATSPPAAGTVDVTVTTPSGTSATSAADQFTYLAGPTVTASARARGRARAAPRSRSPAPASPAPAPSSSARPPATSFTVNSATSITATRPPAAGTVDVTVTTPWGRAPRAPPTSSPTSPGRP